jgi:hypothetical protein
MLVSCQVINLLKFHDLGRFSFGQVLPIAGEDLLRAQGVLETQVTRLRHLLHCQLISLGGFGDGLGVCRVLLG